MTNHHTIVKRNAMSVCQCLTQCICVNVLLLTKNIRCFHVFMSYHPIILRHMTSQNHKFWKIFVSSNGQGQGQTQGQGQLKVKSQGHIIVFTILDVIAVIPFNLWKQNIRALHTIYLNNYDQIDYALDLWPLTFDIWPWLVTIKVNHAVKT